MLNKNLWKLHKI